MKATLIILSLIFLSACAYFPTFEQPITVEQQSIVEPAEERSDVVEEVSDTPVEKEALEDEKPEAPIIEVETTVQPVTVNNDNAPVQTAAPTVKPVQSTVPTATPKATLTLKPVATAELDINTTAMPKPTSTPKATVTLKPTAAPTPKPTEKSTELIVMGSDFNNDVLFGVNNEREFQGNPPLYLDSALCEIALAHAKEMMRQDKMFHDCWGAESVTNSYSGGKSIGIRSANHAGNIALDAERTRLGVGSVRCGDKQYTCVFSPLD